jgi:hypothetical protein
MSVQVAFFLEIIITAAVAISLTSTNTLAAMDQQEYDCVISSLYAVEKGM